MAPKRKHSDEDYIPQTFTIPNSQDSFEEVIAKVDLKSIGLVIDLNNTQDTPRLDLKNHGIKHVKIICRGRDGVPDNESTNYFVYEVSQYLKTHTKANKKRVLVHCHRGFNRTGFMIINYLVREITFTVASAIEVFAEAHPPGIYKDDYINALFSFYNENRHEKCVCPQTPAWATPDKDDDAASTPMQGNQEMKHDDVLGDPIPNDQQMSMRSKCYEFLMLEPLEEKGLLFPGSHPVSLNRPNLNNFRRRYYYATWKAESTRYMMLITKNGGCYLIDNKFNFRRVQMRFPCDRGIPDLHHDWTLVDGEMIVETDPVSNEKSRVYLVDDLLVLNKKSNVESSFSRRWTLIEKCLTEPRNVERTWLIISTNNFPSRGTYYRYDLEPFGVRRKGYWLLSMVKNDLRDYISWLSYKPDGFIFKGWNDCYSIKSDLRFLEWKYPEYSVDFLLEIDDDLRLCYCFEAGEKKLIDEKVTFDDIDCTLCTKKIIECMWNWEEKVWVFKRTKPDKTTPNDINTYNKVRKNIDDTVTEEQLMKEIDTIIRLPLYVTKLRELSNVKQSEA